MLNCSNIVVLILIDYGVSSIFILLLVELSYY